MIFIVGLGNPGRKFQKTRHNLGRLVVNSWQPVAGFPDFRFEKKFDALISEGIFDQKKMILALPETFMNNSGKSIRALTTNYKLQVTSLIVVHDDIDLPLGKIRISKGKSSAGHKGVESIIQELGVKIFIRIRIGIQPEIGKPKNVERFVLQKFNKKEENTVQKIIKKSCLVIEMIIREGLEKAWQKYNQ